MNQIQVLQHPRSLRGYHVILHHLPKFDIAAYRNYHLNLFLSLPFVRAREPCHLTPQTLDSVSIVLIPLPFVEEDNLISKHCVVNLSLNVVEFAYLLKAEMSLILHLLKILIQLLLSAQLDDRRRGGEL